MPVEVTDATFQEQVLDSDKPVLVDFWAPWCGPCKTIAPILEQLEGEFGEQLVIGKVNVDDHIATAQSYGLRGIPTLMLFHKGGLVDQKTGAMSKEDLKQWLSDEVALEPVS